LIIDKDKESPPTLKSIANKWHIGQPTASKVIRGNLQLRTRQDPMNFVMEKRESLDKHFGGRYFEWAWLHVHISGFLQTSRSPRGIVWGRF
jgi:hypothetical protein